MANDKALSVVENNLNVLLKQKQSALPQNFNQTRFLQNCMYVLADTKGIDKYDPMSVARTMLKGAFLDLDFFTGECYAIPYGNELTFQTDYKGERKLAKLYSVVPVKDIYAVLIHKDDNDPIFQIIDGVQHLTFSPSVMKFGKNKDDIKGVLGVILYQDSTYYYEVMGIEEVEHIRNTYSKAPQSPAWKNSYGEMVKKTMIRRLCKNINLQFKNNDQDVAFKEGADITFDDYEEVPEIQMPKRKSETKTEPGKEEPVKADKPEKDVDEVFKTMKEYIKLGQVDAVKKKIDKYNFSKEQKAELEKLIADAKKTGQKELELDALRDELTTAIKDLDTNWSQYGDLDDKSINELKEIVRKLESKK